LEFADAIIKLTSGFPDCYRFLANQLNRASTSIPANIAEGNGRFTKPDRKHFFTIARSSAHECLPYLELIRRRNLLSSEQYEAFLTELEELSRMLAGLIRSSKTP